VTQDDPTRPAGGVSVPWYEPLPRTRLSDRVADAILGSITERGLVPGDRMPTEKQLAEQFGVSRTVVREAVRSLEARGIVRGGPGTGLRVITFDAENVSRSMSLFIRGRPNLTYDEVTEVRAMIEIEIAGRAAQRATPQDIEKLARALDRLEHAIGSDAESEADVALHHTIAEATHNELYDVVLDSIADVLIESRRLSQMDSDDLDETGGSHRPILAAIRAHDPEAARLEMRRHLDASDRAYRRRLACAVSS
jgi:GntR family transcriptional regulator, transcriptional repressor for pyruvate dehydrogenase complex